MLTPVRTDAAAIPRADPAPRASGIRLEVWILAAITLIGAALRFATIASQSYWLDEATTVHELHLSFGSMLHAVANNESTPPLYYVLGWLWAKVFGTGAAGLRSLSALAGVCAIPVAYLCGRDLVSRAAGLVAAALTAVSPFMIWYSQEARAYMLFALLCGLSFMFFVRARREPSHRNLGWWAVCSSLAVLTHFFAGFVIAPEAIWLLIALRSRTAVLSAAVVAAAQLALLPLLVGDLGHPLLGWITQFPLSIRIQQIPVAFAFGTLYQSSLVNDGLVGAACLIVFLSGLVLFGADRTARRAAAAAATVVAAAILVPLVLAEAGHDYYVARNLIGAWIPLVVLVGIACTAMRTLPGGAALAALLLGSFVFAQAKIDADPQYQRPDWQGVAAALGHPLSRRAIVAYDGPFAVTPLSIYLPGVSLNQPSDAGVTVSELDVVGNTWQTAATRMPAGMRLIGTRVVNQFLIARFSITPARRLTPAAINSEAASLVSPASAGAATIVQEPHLAG